MSITMRKLTILDKLHWIENVKTIYNIHYCRAGVGFIFHYPEKGGLSVDGYYPTFEEAVDAEYQKCRLRTS